MCSWNSSIRPLKTLLPFQMLWSQGASGYHIGQQNSQSDDIAPKPAHCLWRKSRFPAGVSGASKDLSIPSNLIFQLVSHCSTQFSLSWTDGQETFLPSRPHLYRSICPEHIRVLYIPKSFHLQDLTLNIWGQPSDMPFLAPCMTFFGPHFFLHVTQPPQWWYVHVFIQHLYH